MLMPRRRLGDSDLEVSVLSLGSWLTFERLPREAGLAIMKAARADGVTFLDDARYNDATGAAPIATGYSEVVFGELFRAAGWDRQLTGKYIRPERRGRVTDELDSPRYRSALNVAQQLETVATRVDQPPAAIAIAYALANPLVARVLFGATTPEQVHENGRALNAFEQLSAPILEELRALT